MSEPVPSVPCFALLAVSNTLAYATFGASIPLLPVILPEGSAVTHSSIVLVAFIIPALFINPIISSKRIAPALSIALTSGAFFEAIGPLLLAVLLLFTRVVHDGSPELHSMFRTQVFMHPTSARALITVAMFFSGLGAALSQYGLVRFVGEQMDSLPVARRRQSVGVHLAVLEACIAVGTIISPVVFVFFATTRDNVFIPFLASGVTQLSLALYLTFVLPAENVGSQLNESDAEQSPSGQEGHRLVSTEEGAMSAYGSTADYDNAAAKPLRTTQPQAPDSDEEEEDEEDPGVLHALKHPWVWMVLFSMLVAASSASFLRPVLTPRITDELHGSRMFAASLFSLCALVGVVSESLAITVLSARLGIRNTVILGLLVCLGGFRILGEKSLISLAVILVVAGSSTSLVLTVTDLSQTTQVNVFGISNSLSLLAAFTFSVGEIIGTVVAGLLYDAYDSFEESVSKWSRFLVIACAIVLAPYLMGLFIQCLSPWMFLVVARRRRVRATTDNQRYRPLLGEEVSIQQRAL